LQQLIEIIVVFSFRTLCSAGGRHIFFETSSSDT